MEWITVGIFGLYVLAIVLIVRWVTNRQIMIIRLEALQSISNPELREKALEVFLSTKKGKTAMKNQERIKARNKKV